MNQDAGKINIVFAADTEDVERGAERIETVLNQTGESAEVAGKRIDNAFKQESMSVRELNDVIETQCKVVSNLRDAYERAKQAASEAFGGDEAKYRELIDTQEKLKKEYDEEVDALRKLNAQRDAMNTSGDAEESLRMRLRAATQELASLTLKYREMSDEEKSSASGQELKNKLEELTKKAGNLRDAMDDANRAIRSTASDTAAFDALAGGLNMVTSTAGAAQGALSMLGVNEEALMDIQTKLQASLAISNALSVVQNNLQKESAVMLGVRRLQEHAASIAIGIRTAAEGKGVIVTKAATVAQAAFNAVAKANPYVLLATVLLGVVAALVGFTKKTKEATEAEKRQAEETKKLREKQEEMSKALGQAAGNLEAKYRSLQQQWNRLKSDADKTKWINDNANAFKELGLKVGSVSDAEKVLVEMAPQVIAALKSVAEAEAYNDLFKQAIVKRATEWERRVKSVETGDYYRIERGGEWISSTTGIPKEWRDAGLTSDDYEDKWVGQYTRKARLNQSGIDKVNAYRIQQARETNKKLEQSYTDEVDFYSKKWEDAANAAEKAKAKIPKSLLDDGSKNDNKNKGNSQKFNDVIDAQTIAQERAIKDMEFSTEQARIDAMKEGSEKTIRQLQLNFEKEFEEIDREYVDLKRQKIENARKLFEADPANKDKTFDESSVNTDYTREENENYIRRLEAIDAAHKESIRKYQTEETQYQIEFLKNYGTFEERRRAITEEYNAKIAEESNEWAKKSLEMQKQKALSELDMTILKFKIDWGSVFGNLADRSIEELERIKKELEELSESGNIQDITQIKELQEAISSIKQEFASRQGGFAALRDSLKEARIATNKLQKAEENLQRARLDGDSEAIRAAEKEVELARIRKNTATKSVDAAKKAAADLLNTVANLDFSSFSGVFSGLKDLSPTIDSVFKTNISGIFQKLGDEMVDALGAFADKVLTMANNISSLFGSNEKDTYYEREFDMFEALGQAIDNLAEEIKDSSPKEALDYYYEQVDLIKDQTAAAQSTLQTAMAHNYMGSGTGCLAKWQDRAYNSTNKWINDYFTATDWDKISKLTGKYVHDASSLWNLTPEDLYDIQTHLGNVWGKIKQALTRQSSEGPKDSGGGGATASSNSENALENYLSMARKLEEAEKDIAEYLANISFDSVEESFMSAIKDMKKDAKDFSEDVADILADALTNLELSKEGGIKDKLQEWYDKLVEVFQKKTRGELTAEALQNEIDVLRNEYVKYSEEARDIQKWANEVAGVGTGPTSQESTSRGFETMTQDQASELSGRFTGIQMETAMIDAKLDKMIENNTAIRANAATIAEGMSTMTDLQGVAVSHLAQIEKNTNELPEMNERLSKIEKNTRNL